VNPSLVLTGTANGANINVDVANGLSTAAPVSVTLTADYTLADPQTPGYPTQPGLTGIAYSGAQYPGRVIPAGTVLELLAPEAAALVAAGAATLT